MYSIAITLTIGRLMFDELFQNIEAIVNIN